MKCKLVQFMMMMMMMMGVEKDRRKRYEADDGRKWKRRRRRRRRRGCGEMEGEQDIADFSSAIVRPDSISSRETRIHRCAPCSEHVWVNTASYKNGYLLRH
jgi:hypothetical protein